MSRHRHLTLADLFALEEGRLPKGEFGDFLMRHLAECCPHCAAGLALPEEAWASDEGPESGCPLPALPYREELQGADLVPAFYALLARVRRELFESPAEAALTLVEAVSLVEDFPARVPESVYLESYALARCVEAQLALVEGELARARCSLRLARSVMREVADPQVLAEWEITEALFARAQGRGADTLPLLASARRRLLAIDDGPRAAAVLLAEAWIAEDLERQGAALQLQAVTRWTMAGAPNSEEFSYWLNLLVTLERRHLAEAEPAPARR